MSLMPKKKKKPANPVTNRDTPGAPNTPSRASSTKARAVEGVDVPTAGDGKVSIPVIRKPRVNTGMRDLLIEIRAAFNRWKTWSRFSINQKRADGRVLHELLDRINEVL